ncbi:MAG: lytic transglycosylase domain-containing protein [Desulfohalobiaceae bacterium]|nr:lytic transglycosylase domain-containing protein [Desulfohalobiaceae bacterium]
MQVHHAGSPPGAVIESHSAENRQAGSAGSNAFEHQLSSAFQARTASQNTGSEIVQDDADKAPLIDLGTVTSEQPTVSHLLAKHPEYASRCWQIIHSEVNSDKPYTRIPEGTRIAYNQESREIVWDTDESQPPAVNSPLLPVTGSSRPADQPSLQKNAHHLIERSVSRASAKYGLSRDLIRGVIQAESDFQPRAVSPAGAQGLMQLMPATARELGVKNPFDISENIDAGARYLKKMLTLFNGDLEQALAAYNAGPRTIQESNGEIPYRETRHFVQRVLSFSRRLA